MSWVEQEMQAEFEEMEREPALAYADALADGRAVGEWAERVEDAHVGEEVSHGSQDRVDAGESRRSCR